jgi:hypothetical protein
MSDAADAYDSLTRPLRTDVPFVRDWSMSLEVGPGHAIEPASLVLDALRPVLDEAPTLGALTEYEWVRSTDPRDRDDGPPCSHVPRPGRYLAYRPVEARVEIEGERVQVFVRLDGCEQCVTHVRAFVAEEEVRRAWRVLRGQVEGDEELRPWRDRELVEPMLRRIVAALLPVAPELRAELRWGDRRGTWQLFRDGAWADVER